MSDNELLIKIATQVKDLNDTINAITKKGYKVSLFENPGAGEGAVDAKNPLRIKVSSEVLDTNLG